MRHFFRGLIVLNIIGIDNFTLLGARWSEMSGYMRRMVIGCIDGSTGLLIDLIIYSTPREMYTWTTLLIQSASGVYKRTRQSSLAVDVSRE